MCERPLHYVDLLSQPKWTLSEVPVIICEAEVDRDPRYTEDDNATKPPPVVAETKAAPARSVEPTVEDAAAQPEQHSGDIHDASGEQDMDDEIDFNLGNGDNNGDATNESHGTGIKEDG